MDENVKVSDTIGRAPDYSRVLADLNSALSTDPLTKPLTTSVRLLRESSDHFDCIEINLVYGNDLVLEAYAGDTKTEHVRIPTGQGTCGSAAKEGTTTIVPDFNQDPRYFMCSLQPDRRSLPR